MTLALVGTLAIWRFTFATPRTWEPSEIPIAWWAWRQRTPSAAELKAAGLNQPNQLLFLRAGQLDQTPGGLRRIRAVEGHLPAGPELHLVYNATRALLGIFKQVPSDELAAVIAANYAQDAQRAQQDCAKVAGLQLDLDVPSSALPQYGELLRALRQRLPAGTALSITGLETWLGLPEVKGVLAATDYWIPQCYGAQIPQRLSQSVPIATPAQVASLVSRAGELGQPFYAGLAAYGYAILYATDGTLLELRGDLNPSLIADHPDLDLVERKPFNSPIPSWFSPPQMLASEWRYVYRAQRHCVIDGLVLRTGESLVLDVPSAAGLRASAQAVREHAGSALLGLCVFRLPGAEDGTTLSQAEIAAALSDSPSPISIKTSATLQPKLASLTLTVSNHSATSSLLGARAFLISLRIPTGSVRAWREPSASQRIETFCESTPGETVQPCSWRRANLLRLSANHLRSGEQLTVELAGLPADLTQLTTELEFRADDGRLWQERRLIPLTVVDGSLQKPAQPDVRGEH